MKKTRYFFISYYMTGCNNMFTTANSTVVCKTGFVNNQETVKQLLLQFPQYDSAIVTNIYEFKNKSDFDDFNRVKN